MSIYDIEDPLRPLQYALEQARLANRMIKIINSIKRVGETDEQALIRLVHERNAVGKILDRLGVKADQYDTNHRNTNIIQELAKIVPGKK